MRISVPRAVLVLCLAGVPLVNAQSWTVEQLRERSKGFDEEGLQARLAAIAELLRHRSDASQAIRASIQGDHREYLLKIDRLLDQLADDRWAVREDAERQLVEVGARAMARIAERKKNGQTLEERIRAARIETQIAKRGTAAEEAEIRLLRGLVDAARYFEPDERLAEALTSAAGHTDPIVAEGAIRALGAVGGQRGAEFLANRLRVLPANQWQIRRTVLGAMAELRNPASLAALTAALTEGQLTRDERLGLVLDLRQRADAGELVALLAADADASVAQAARSTLPTVDAAPLPSVRVQLGDNTEFTAPLSVIRSNEVTIEGVLGLERAHIPRDRIHHLDFVDHAAVPSPPARVYLLQGSILAGNLRSVDREVVRFGSPVFGEVDVPRDSVQGLALDPGVDRLVGASADHDRVRLQDGSMLDGEIESIDPTNAVLVLRQNGATREVAMGSVHGVLFRRQPAAARDERTLTRLDTVRGDRLLIDLAAIDASHAAVVLEGLGTATLPIADVARIEFGVGGGAMWGFTIVADYSANEVFEIDDEQRVVFRLDQVYGIWDVECLENGNLLIVEFALGRVVEMRRDRTEVWAFEKLKNPYDADRLANGNTLIADTYGNRVIEVDERGQVVWTFDRDVKPIDVERLTNGNTLIADSRRDRLIEVDGVGNVVWEKTGLESVWDVDSLPNGNLLITQRTGSHRVFEMDREGQIVFEIRDLTSPSDADRLPNGNTIVAEDGRVREFDRFGKVVWEQTAQWAVEVNRY